MMVWSLRLAPATAAMLVAFSALRHGNDASGTASGDDVLLGIHGSNQITYVAAPYDPQRNEVEIVTFDWTNRAGSTSSISSFSPDSAK